jgi:hypothetical protein
VSPSPGVPVQLDRELARRLAESELARPEYQRDRPGLLERAATWLLDRLGELLDRAGDVSPGGWPGLLATLVVLVLVAVAIRLRTGPLAASGGGDRVVVVGGSHSAARHRAVADALAAQQAWAAAVRERLRAVVRDLEERGLLDPRPGRTADEVAREAGAILPVCAADLREAARLFDDVWYGARPATAEHDRFLRGLDERVRAARPTPAGAPP